MGIAASVDAAITHCSITHITPANAGEPLPFHFEFSTALCGNDMIVGEPRWRRGDDPMSNCSADEQQPADGSVLKTFEIIPPPPPPML